MKLRKLSGGVFIASYSEEDNVIYERALKDMNELKHYISRTSTSYIEFDSIIGSEERLIIIRHYYRIS